MIGFIIGLGLGYLLFSVSKRKVGEGILKSYKLGWDEAHKEVARELKEKGFFYVGDEYFKGELFDMTEDFMKKD